MQRIGRAGLCVLALAALVAGCGSDDDNDKADTSGKAKTEKPSRGFEGAKVVAGCEIKPRTVCKDADLSGADLRHADLVTANLSGAILRDANLRHADLLGANLNRSTLIDAKLYKADLGDAQLVGAQVDGADLTQANLDGANVENTDLSKAKLCKTTMPDGALKNDDC